MTRERRTAAAALSGQRERARSAVEASRHREALEALQDGAANAFLLHDVSALEEIGALASRVKEKASDGYVKARGAEVVRRAQSYRCRSWQSSAKIPARDDEVDSILEISSQSR